MKLSGMRWKRIAAHHLDEAAFRSVEPDLGVDVRTQSRSLSSLATTLDTHDYVLVHDLLPPLSLGTSSEANEHWRARDADHQSSGMKV